MNPRDNSLSWVIPPPPHEITALRNKLGMSQDEFAKLFGFYQQHICDFESGRYKMWREIVTPFRRLQSVADHLLARRTDPDWTL